MKLCFILSLTALIFSTAPNASLVCPEGYDDCKIVGPSSLSRPGEVNQQDKQTGFIYSYHDGDNISFYFHYLGETYPPQKLNNDFEIMGKSTAVLSEPNPLLTLVGVTNSKGKLVGYYLHGESTQFRTLSDLLLDISEETTVFDDRWMEILSINERSLIGVSRSGGVRIIFEPYGQDPQPVNIPNSSLGIPEGVDVRSYVRSARLASNDNKDFAIFRIVDPGQNQNRLVGIATRDIFQQGFSLSQNYENLGSDNDYFGGRLVYDGTKYIYTIQSKTTAVATMVLFDNDLMEIGRHQFPMMVDSLTPAGIAFGLCSTGEDYVNTQNKACAVDFSNASNTPSLITSLGERCIAIIVGETVHCGPDDSISLSSLFADVSSLPVQNADGSFDLSALQQQDTGAEDIGNGDNSGSNTGSFGDVTTSGGGGSTGIFFLPLTFVLAVRRRK